MSDCATPVVKALRWENEAAAQAMAEAWAQCPAIAQACITLEGGLGAGKTTFVRHLLRALGVQGRIKSPTYALVEPYDIDHAPLGPFGAWHFDLYRLQSRAEWESAGFRDTFASLGLKLVEWPQRVLETGIFESNPQGVAVFRTDVAIKIEANNFATDTSEADRHVTLTAHTALGQQLLAAYP